MRRLVTVQVTGQRIGDGVARSCYRCPVALALWDLVKEGTTLRVYTGFIYVNDLVCYLPEEATEFIRVFDERLMLSEPRRLPPPFEFKMWLPEEVLR